MTMPLFARRYGAFALVLSVLIAVLVIAPTKSPTQVQSFGGAGEEPGARSSAGASDPAIGSDPSQASAPGSGAGTASGDSTVPGRAGAGTGAATAPDCSRRAILGPTATCKPAFSGGNGGPGSKGVTAKEITLVWYRNKANEQVQGILNSTGDAEPADEQELGLQRMVAWFNENFQLYGRRVKLVYVQGKADNKDVPAMRADAQELDEKYKAFLVLSGGRADFIDELARRQVISLGAPQLPLSFSTTRAPFVYGVVPDADTTNAHIVEYIGKRLGPRSTARYGGDVSAPQVNGAERRYGIVFPTTPETETAADDLRRRLAAVGVETSAMIGYAADINQAATSAQNVVTQLTSAGITTVLCVCDPIAPIFFTGAATKQGYYPEWFMTGYYLQDLMSLARLYDQTQWAHSFGISTLAVAPPDEETAAWKMQKAVAPDETPVSISGYANLLVAFSAIELAGPRLDPGTYRDGAFRFEVVSQSKFETSFGYGPQDFGGVDDAKEVWWDASGTDPSDGKNGTYRNVNDGYRYRLGGWPATEPKPFDTSCLDAGSCGGPRYG